MEASWTRDWNCVPYTGQQILNHWSTREVQLVVLFDPLSECDPSCLLFRIFLPWAFTSERGSTQTLAIYPDSQIRGTRRNIFSLCRLPQAVVIVLWHQGHVILSPLQESCSPLFIPHLSVIAFFCVTSLSYPEWLFLQHAPKHSCYSVSCLRASLCSGHLPWCLASGIFSLNICWTKGETPKCPSRLVWP